VLKRPDMKTRAPLVALLLSLSALGGLGCAATSAPPATVVVVQEQTKTRYIVAPVSFDGFTVDGRSEGDWLATQGHAERARWGADRKRLALDLAESMYDAGSSFDAAVSAPGPHVLVQLRLVSYDDGVFQFALTATDETGRVVIAPALVTTRRGAHNGLSHGYRSFVIKAASVIAQIVTRAGDIPEGMALVEADPAPWRNRSASVAIETQRFAGPQL